MLPNSRVVYPALVGLYHTHIDKRTKRRKEVSTQTDTKKREREKEREKCVSWV